MTNFVGNRIDLKDQFLIVKIKELTSSFMPQSTSKSRGRLLVDYRIGNLQFHFNSRVIKCENIITLLQHDLNCTNVKQTAFTLKENWTKFTYTEPSNQGLFYSTAFALLNPKSTRRPTKLMLGHLKVAFLLFSGIML